MTFEELKKKHEELKAQFERQALKAAAYKDEMNQTHDRLAEARSLYMYERQRRQNLEQENEQLKKELQEERIGNSQADGVQQEGGAATE
ncbi:MULTISPECIES: hypothetical protein [Bacillus]|uniref:Uncharacterized protein n=1 Tax=Bacillus glycinifermentans TaxID=1664069 RepID=A0AAJ3Z0G7_9BACI|nr:MULTISPECIES: hypothetical protein [Bacillus]MBU8786785.1 hypothetical protein [Bacillus glycinifermentans]MDU0070023.1 hypothetical protein [Bacillus sp. IG6]MED8017696.1 hypothetical protein [Bacillus glycinifermentans]QAT66368.1 hypothetical protein EQZ20_16665 [Bacillus glycinifermentans]WKB76089.1 hypothetical protein QYM22_17000 [Bacillus glycinifermentans]